MGLDFQVYKDCSPVTEIGAERFRVIDGTMYRNEALAEKMLPEGLTKESFKEIYCRTATRIFGDGQVEGLDKVAILGDQESDWFTILFRAGESMGDTPHFSYSGWGNFRNALARGFFDASQKHVWTNIDKYKKLPMSLLINFRDCAGVMGPIACGKIADAMRAGLVDGSYERFAKVYNNSWGDKDWNRIRYESVMNMFDYARDTGFVVFC